MKGPKWLAKLNEKEFENDELKSYLDCLKNGAHIMFGPGEGRIYMEERIEWPSGNVFGCSWSIDHSGPFPSWVKR